MRTTEDNRKYVTSGTSYCQISNFRAQLLGDGTLLVDLLSFLESETPDTVEVMTGNIYIKEVHKLAKIPQGADKVLVKLN